MKTASRSDIIQSGRLAARLQIARRLFSLPFLPLLLAPFVLLSPVLLGGKALFWGTPLLQFVPWWNWAWETIQAGHLPLWNPLVGMGAPLVANYQSALFYPPTWLYFALAALGGLPALAWGQALLVALHLAWAGVGMAILARRLGLGRLAQALSGLAFGLCGYLVARAGFLSINATVSWIPWVILAVTALIDQPSPEPVDERNPAFPPFFVRGKLPAFLGLAVCLGMQLLAGHAQTTWYTWLLAGMWAGYWGWRQVGQDGSAHKRKDWMRRARGVGRAWAWLGLGIAAAFALAAVQLLPTAEYLRQSQRAAAVDYEFAMNYSFWPWRLLTLIAPDMFGNPVRGDFWGYATYWEDALYVGMLPLLLASGALLRGTFFSRKKAGPSQPDVPSLKGPQKEGLAPFLGGLLLLTLALALGKNTPLFPWLYRHVPTFSMFQAPSRYLIWAEFALALLAGMGAEAWRRPTGRGLYWTRMATVGSVAVTLSVLVLWFLMGKSPTIPTVSLTFIRATALAGIWGIGSGLLSLLAPPKGDRMAGDASSRWKWAVVAFVAADLLFAGWGLNPGASLDVYSQAAPTVSRVRSLTRGERIFLPDEDEQELKFSRFLRFDTFNPGEDWSNLRAILLPDINMLEGLPSANNFDPLVPGRYARWMKFLDGTDSQTQGRLLNLMGVRVVERMDETQPYGVRFDLPLETPDASRLRWVSCARSALDSEDAWNLVTGGQVDLRVEVVLEVVTDSSPIACKTSGSWALVDQVESPNQLRAHLRTDSPGWLVLSDVWYPGWQARIDGKPTPVLHADYLFRAIQLPAGEHEVAFTYRPLSFWLGLSISLLAWIGLAAIAIKMLKEMYWRYLYR